MKKLLTVVIIAATGIGNVHAVAINCCGGAPCVSQMGTTFDSSCTEALVCNCSGSTSMPPNLSGVISTYTNKLETYCVGNVAYARCGSGPTTYKCASGYYGTATSSTSGCTKCPSNATCAGGNGSTFRCNANYYKSGSACEPCPNGGKSSSGSTDITSCYLSAGTSFSDSTGSGEYSGNCYYTK